MNYTVYIGNDCHQCDEVVKYLDEHHPEVKIVNIDTEEVYPPVKIYIRPTLFKNNQLVCYGSDIVDHFKKAEQTAV